MPTDHTNRLPALKPGALWAVEAASAVAADAFALSGIPGGATLAAVMKGFAKRHIEKGTKILIEELENANIGILNEEQAQVFIPNAYRFYEAVKQGEYEHNLRLLARIMAGNARGNGGTSADVMRFARKIEGLTESELAVLWNCYQLSERKLPRQAKGEGPHPISSATLHHITPEYKKFRESEVRELKGALSVLSSRGFLIPDGASRTGKSEETYHISESLRELIKLAKLKFPSQDTPPTN